MLIKAEMDSKLFDVNEELKKRNMKIEHLEKQNKILKDIIKNYVKQF